MGREPSPTTVYFVRHGQATRFADAADAGLTEAGVQQAVATAQFLTAQFLPAQFLTGQPVAAVYTSGARRAMDTAAILAQAWGRVAIVDPRLCERAEYDPTADMPVADFVAMWERANVQRDWQPPLGDSANACGLRMAAFVAACHAQWPGRHVVAVSHGGAIADLLHQLVTQAGLAARNPALAARPYDGAVLRECSVTVVRVDAADVTLLAAASAAHLP
ncbi:MAG: histidine phosphatase family protein [Caldilineaceae bacterium]|nr:histidine phosphatase family protein [Caldilineaceae bacterium]